MILLLTFAAIFVVGQAMNVGIAIAAERISEPVSLALFFGLFGVVVVAGWQLAVRLTDRFAGRAPQQRRS